MITYKYSTCACACIPQFIEQYILHTYQVSWQFRHIVNHYPSHHYQAKLKQVKQQMADHDISYYTIWPTNHTIKL